MRRFDHDRALLRRYLEQLGDWANPWAKPHTTVQAPSDALPARLVVRVLEPWYANIVNGWSNLRRFTFRDSGLLHTLLGIANPANSRGIPWLAGSWEGFVIRATTCSFAPGQCLITGEPKPRRARSVVVLKGRRIGIEIKRADAPKMTPSMVRRSRT